MTTLTDAQTKAATVLRSALPNRSIGRWTTLEFDPPEPGADVYVVVIDRGQADGDLFLNSDGTIAVAYDEWGIIEHYFEQSPLLSLRERQDEDDYPVWEVTVCGA